MKLATVNESGMMDLASWKMIVEIIVVCLASRFICLCLMIAWMSGSHGVVQTMNQGTVILLTLQIQDRKCQDSLELSKEVHAQEMAILI